MKVPVFKYSVYKNIKTQENLGLSLSIIKIVTKANIYSHGCQIKAK